MTANKKLINGLTQDEVNYRIRENLVNYDTVIPTKTILQIIKDNVLTLFNFLNFALGLAIFLVGSYKNLLFLGVVVCNTIISTYQEIRSKKIIDKLSLISATKVSVIRDGKNQRININEIVLDDIVINKIGDQVVVDSLVLEGTAEVNESFITGESESVYKKPGDTILSGSFILSGNITSKVVHIGEDNYTSKISKDAKYVKKTNSQILRSLDKVIKYISIILVVLGVLLYYKQISIPNNTLEEAVISTVAALISMIPEGLVLLTSTVLMVSVIKLAKSNVLVQELYCIETLARVDTICLDKTGTITEGDMVVDGIIPLNNYEVDDINVIMGHLVQNLDNDNTTIGAIKKEFKAINDWKVKKIIPFSSARKYSGVSFNEGTFIIGAPEVILKDNINKIKTLLDNYAKENRVILLAHSKQSFESEKLPNQIEVVGLVLIKDKIRRQAANIIKFFKDQNVDIKIISGDNVNTISEIAKKVGINNKAIDTCNLNDEKIRMAASKYNVFGRVTPFQKKLLILALQNEGHTVAMIGDGVNDVLALKEADCSIALASGSDAAKNVSQLVLLDSNFDSMPRILNEGRQTINNIERSATLFLCKTIYSILLAILFLFINMQYPFEPIQFTLTSSFTIGIPAFILSLEKNNKKISGNFLISVLRKSLPAAMSIVICIGMITFLHFYLNLTEEQTSTLCVITTAFMGFNLLIKICKPFNRLRIGLLAFLITGFVVSVVGLKNLFSLSLLTPKMLILIAVLFSLTVLIYNFIGTLFETVIIKQKKRIK